MSFNEQVVEALSRLLADTYTLFLETHNSHWNVTGPMFNTLHTLFETQYTEFAELASVKEDRGFPTRRTPGC